ncbi:hypothetical protein KFE25_004613 [Diacronema lutheri]|uniref:AP2/ERF domain-containing protein n=1 Tax=Diacronema lutheri TaxID=2081491 RepID=A0A8J6C5I0_DIALT|nr:hypothetical protein KFE25_004613 [Diacronema lutheri]
MSGFAMKRALPDGGIGADEDDSCLTRDNLACAPHAAAPAGQMHTWSSVGDPGAVRDEVACSSEAARSDLAALPAGSTSFAPDGGMRSEGVDASSGGAGGMPTASVGPPAGARCGAYLAAAVAPVAAGAGRDAGAVSAPRSGDGHGAACVTSDADADASVAAAHVPSRGHTSRFRGVSLKSGRKSNPWKAVITVHNQTRHLGYFASEHLAAAAYDAIARQYGRAGNFPAPNAAVTSGCAGAGFAQRHPSPPPFAPSGACAGYALCGGGAKQHLHPRPHVGAAAICAGCAGGTRALAGSGPSASPACSPAYADGAAAGVFACGAHVGGFGASAVYPPFHIGQPGQAHGQAWGHAGFPSPHFAGHFRSPVACAPHLACACAHSGAGGMGACNCAGHYGGGRGAVGGLCGGFEPHFAFGRGVGAYGGCGGGALGCQLDGGAFAGGGACCAPFACGSHGAQLGGAHAQPQTLQHQQQQQDEQVAQMERVHDVRARAHVQPPEVKLEHHADFHHRHHQPARPAQPQLQPRPQLQPQLQPQQHARGAGADAHITVTHAVCTPHDCGPHAHAAAFSVHVEANQADADSRALSCAAMIGAVSATACRDGAPTLSPRADARALASGCEADME